MPLGVHALHRQGNQRNAVFIVMHIPLLYSKMYSVINCCTYSNRKKLVSIFNMCAFLVKALNYSVYKNVMNTYKNINFSSILNLIMRLLE